MSAAKPSIPDRGMSNTGLRFGSNMDSRRHRNQRVWPPWTEGACALHLHIGSSISVLAPCPDLADATGSRTLGIRSTKIIG
jgi:hypothetical protein